MTKIEADLHNHTTYSDGTMTPSELIAWGVQRGLAAMAITDHDTAAGLEEARLEGRRRRVRIIPGVEVTVRFSKPWFTGSLHYLLYFSDELSSDPVFLEDLTSVVRRGRGTELFRRRIEALNRSFGPRSDDPVLPRELTLEEVQTLGDNLTRRHLAVALKRFLGITDRETLNRMIGNSSPAYLPSGVELDELAPLFYTYPQVLRVLAHPAAGSFPGESHYKEVLPPFDIVKKLLPEFLKLGLDGFEINYPGHTEKHKAELESLRAFLRLPLATGGSDCHDRKNRPLAVDGVGMEVVELILSMFAEDPSNFKHRTGSAGSRE